MYHDTTAAHLAVGHYLSPVRPSGIRSLTSSEIKAVQKALSNSRWRHIFLRSITCSMDSALDMLMTMRYTNLRFIIIIIIIIIIIVQRCLCKIFMKTWSVVFFREVANRTKWQTPGKIGTRRVTADCRGLVCWTCWAVWCCHRVNDCMHTTSLERCKLTWII